MGINLVVAVTDPEWFRQLSRRPDLGEVNFWAPSARNFRALKRGELFLFKLRGSPHVIVGGGVFAYASNLPCSLAWQAFGQGNGAQSADEMRERIAGLRRSDRRHLGDFEIGCRILTDAFFFQEAEWIPVPNWPGTTPLKTYNTANPDGRLIWESVFGLSKHEGVSMPNVAERRYALRLVAQRLHQDSFRKAVIAAYNGRCAVSRLAEPDLLDAAHIISDRDERLGQPVVQNGMPLSKLHHAAFDRHLIGVDPDYHLHVSERLLSQKDGPMLEALKKLQGGRIRLPRRLEDRPDRDRLAQRFELFKAAA